MHIDLPHDLDASFDPPIVRDATLSVQGVHGGGGVCVGQGHDVAVGAQGGGGVFVAEPVLGLQQVSLGDQRGSDGVSQSVQGDLRGEQPRSKRTSSGSSAPDNDAVAPQRRGGVAQGDPADPSSLGRADRLAGSAAADGQHIAVQIVDLQPGQFAAAGAAVGGQPAQQQDLLGLMQCDRVCAGSGLGGALFSVIEDVANLI